MEAPGAYFDAMTFALRLAATLFFVAVNGFFVAAEFALVKVRAAQFATLAKQGSRSARTAGQIHAQLNRYLSACQLGITVASLILGWLAEPAVAELILAGVAAVDWNVAPDSPIVHGVALAIALTVITVLHMTIGEQAPKIWAIHRSLSTAMFVAYPLQLFEIVFRPFIWVIHGLSNGLLSLVGLSPDELGDSSHNVEELKSILAASAEAGHISTGQLELAENIFGIMTLEVRHILVPRVDVVFLSEQNSPEENLRIIRESGHSRFPLCRIGLDSVTGIVHAKDVMASLATGVIPDVAKLARKPVFVSDTQPLSGLIFRMQRTRSHSAVVLDEHGTAIGLAFLEDALEEIVGPIRDEFDEADPEISRLDNGVIEVPGDLALPEAALELELSDLGDESDTIGGHVVATLGRLPRRGDQLDLGGYRVTVIEVSRNRIARLRFEPPGGGAVVGDEAAEAPED